MRILQMIASLAESGGAEMLARNLALDYARRGHQCHIVYISDAGSLDANVEYERAFKAQMDAAGIGHTMLGHATKRNLALGAWRLRKTVRAFGPDVVHIHLGYGLLFQTVGLLRVATIYTHHNIVFKFPTKLFRVFDRFVDRYVAICETCRVLLARHVGKPIALIYNGVPSDFAGGGPRGRLPRDVRVLSVGNLSPQKDYPTLIAAAEWLVPLFAAQGRRIEFSIAGEGGERAALEREIAGRGLGEHVRLLGARRDVAALMAEADLLVQCSRFEGLPITLIEGAMSALPTIASDVGGCAEIVEDGVTGLLVSPGDPARLGDAMVEILSDEERYVAFSAAAPRRAYRFDLAQCADAHLALYAEVTGK